MICRYPLKLPGIDVPVGCGQCLPCRVNRRREWTARLVLESALHAESMWVTLTYSDEFIPSDGSLSIQHYQQFLKRLRKSIYPVKVRYYIVGEYGDTTGRPHYHAVLFGINSPTDVINAWSIRGSPIGSVHFGDVSPQSIAYNCKHIVKAMHRSTDIRLQGRLPEFSRMSLRPGIGHDAMKPISQWLTSDKGSQWLAGSGDVNQVIRIGPQIWPLNRYLRDILRDSLGMDRGTPQAYIDRMDSFMRTSSALGKGEEVNSIIFQKRLLSMANAETAFLRSKLYKGSL